jgi:hypothetical protein
MIKLCLHAPICHHGLVLNEVASVQTFNIAREIVFIILKHPADFRHVVSMKIAQNLSGNSAICLSRE